MNANAGNFVFCKRRAESKSPVETCVNIQKKALAAFLEMCFCYLQAHFRNIKKASEHNQQPREGIFLPIKPGSAHGQETRARDFSDQP